MPNYQYLWGNYQAHWTSVDAYLSLFVDLKHLLPWNECKNKIQVSRGNRIATFQHIADLDADIERGKLFLEKSFYHHFLRQAAQRCKEHQDFFTSLKNVNWEKTSNEQLLDLLAQAREQFQLTVSYFKPTQGEGMHYLVESIKKMVSEEEASLLMTPVELDQLNHEQLAWSKIVEEPYSELRILEHVEKYPWVVASHFTLSDVVHTLKQKYEYDKVHALPLDIHQKKLELKQQQENILAGNQELRELASRAQQLAICRMYVKSCWAGTEFYTLPIFAQISQRTGEDIYDLARYYVFSEIKQLLREQKRLSAQEKENREKCVIGLLKEGKVILKSGDGAENLAKQELAELYEIKNFNEVKGIVANPGKVQGIARILQSNNMQQNNELRKTFRKGDILITQMTQPNIVDIASRAGGIVTEEGGMLSHAAIISREFKIPCIVGTHTATTVFKDGEMIEVDAQAGIVRKL